MKRVFFTLFAIGFAASICFAEEASAPSSADNSANPAQVSTATTASAQTSTTNVSSTNVSSTAVTPVQATSSTISSTPVGTDTFTGKVGLVSNGNSMSGQNPQITVKDDSGKEMIFTVASDATIIGKDGNTTSLNWISKDDKVAIDYTTAQDGTKTAKAIKVSSSW